MATTRKSEVICPICEKSRIVWHNPETSKVCHSCAGKEISKRESWRAAINKRSALRWTEESKKRQSIIAREKLLERGGVPNAVKFTKGSTVGDKNHRWRGGITAETVRLRNSQLGREWTATVLKRDKYTCQLCSKVGGSLHAHHIKPWSKEVTLRFDVANGITLCGGRSNGGCHRELVHRGSWRNEPMSIAEIQELRSMVQSGAVSIDWL